MDHTQPQPGSGSNVVIVVLGVLAGLLFLFILIAIPIESRRVPSCAQQVVDLPKGVEVKDEVGGLWLTPYEREQVIHGPILIQAQAYPAEGPNANNVVYVNITSDFPKWHVLSSVCTSDIKAQHTYTYLLDPEKLGIPPGTRFTISFDVYSRSGNYNLSPNGEHVLIYQLP